MKLHFERVGGFAGKRFVTDIDTENMAERDRKKFYTILQKSGILDTQISSDTHSTDRFQYRVQVGHDLSFETPTEPKEVRPLLRFLEKLQNPNKKSTTVGKKIPKKGRKRTS